MTRILRRAHRLPRAMALAASAAIALVLAACATEPAAPTARRATVQRTAHGVAHISAPDFETLAYGMAYAYAQDNVCMTAQHLVTVRGQRSRHFGGAEQAALGLRQLPNEQIDLFVAAFMDDARLAAVAAQQRPDVQALTRGYVAGYNRFLADHAGRLPAACNNASWVQPMTAAEYLRIGELSAVQAGLAALADAVLAAQPPRAGTAGAPSPRASDRIDVAAAAQAMREAGVLDSPFGSNAWAFGRDTTANGRGVLLGNPHFPWVGVNRFWQAHLTVPGQLDVMGVGIGTSAAVVIGFNKDIAWSHTVSTGKRFTLHELTLAPNDPTSYLVDGQPEKMRSRTVTVEARDASGALVPRSHTFWSTRWGPVIALQRAGLTWTAQRAYALQDANTGNMRSSPTVLDFGRATSVADLQKALKQLGTAWVNTIAADRHGNALYADVSTVPDVDAAQLARCAPSREAAALLPGAGLVVLNGSRSDCAWRQDAASPVPGLTPYERMPVAVRSDWVHNSNDSFFYTHPQQRFGTISPLVGDDVVRSPRTRSGLIEIPQLLSRGPVTPQAIQAQLFANHNLMAQMVLPDLLAACDHAPTPEAREACAALRAWDRRSDTGSRGAHLFREFWRAASGIPGVYREPFDKARPVATPAGLRMSDAAVAQRVWFALEQAASKVRGAGFALDAPLGSVQRPAITDEPIALHGGHGIEGVLNYLGDVASAGIGPRGIRIDYGTSYVQTVTFDDRGPVAQALLTYGQSTDPASPHLADQLRLFSAKQWPTLPFHPEDVARERVGPVLQLQRP